LPDTHLSSPDVTSPALKPADAWIQDRAGIQNRAGALLPALSIRSQLRAKAVWLLFIGIVFVLISLAIYPLLPRSYHATALVLLQPTDQNGRPDYDRVTRNALDENAIQAYSDILAARPLLMVVARQHQDDPEFNPALRQTRSWLGDMRLWLSSAISDPNETVEDRLRKHLIIRRDHQSYVLQVGFSSEDPAKASDMANRLVDAFVAGQVADKQHIQNNFVSELEQRTATLQARYLASEAAAHDFFISSGLIHKGERLSAEHQLDTFSTEFAKAKSDAQNAEDRATALLEMQRRGTLDSAPEVMASPVVQAVKEKFMTLNGHVASGVATLSAMTDIQSAISAEADRIVRALQADAVAQRRRADSLGDQINRLDAQLVSWQEADRRMTELQRNLDVDRAALQQGLADLAAQRGLAALLRPDVQIVSYAVPPTRPAFPNKLLYSLGTLLMVLVTFATVLLLPGKARAIAARSSDSRMETY
jgi:succinoglycan biosynthesis transport protein ExoP